jgi:hypothetical protein
VAASRWPSPHSPVVFGAGEESGMRLLHCRVPLKASGCAPGHWSNAQRVPANGYPWPWSVYRRLNPACSIFTEVLNIATAPIADFDGTTMRATWPGTRAEQFYRKAGWRVTGMSDGNLVFEK